MLPDLLREGLRVVFCGTAAGKKSAEVKAYYAHSGNKFYKTLSGIGLTDRTLIAADYRQLLTFGVGLTDLNQIDSGMDHQISPANCDVPAFRKKMLKYRPKIIAFTSKKGGQIFYGRNDVAYGEHAETLNGIRVFVLPSPSGANASWKGHAHHWQLLQDALRAL